MIGDPGTQPITSSSEINAGKNRNSCSVNCIFSQIVPASVSSALREVKERKQTLLREGDNFKKKKKKKGKVISGSSGLRICRYR